MKRFFKAVCVAAALTAAVCVGSNAFAQEAKAADGVFKLGVIGATTSHVPAFVSVINNPDGEELYQKFEVVAVYPGGMPDNPDSWDRVEKYTSDCVAAGLTVYPTVEELVANVDGVLLESVDGRPHLEQAKPVIAAKKPLFVDKPMAGSLADVLEMFRLAKENDVPIFTASSLRFVAGYQKMRNEQPLGEIFGCDATSPCSTNPKHPSLYWYGIHGVESLFTIMGPDCVSVSRTNTTSADVVVGVWKGRKIGTFRGVRKGAATYGAKVFAEKGVEEAGTYEGYEPLVREICKFFETGVAPVSEEETTAIFAFMTAADMSRRAKGASVDLKDAIKAAKAEKRTTVNIRFTAKSEIIWTGEDGAEKTVEMGELRGLVEAEAENCDVVRVILDNRVGVPIDTVHKVLTEVEDAYLANYLY